MSELKGNYIMGTSVPQWTNVKDHYAQLILETGKYIVDNAHIFAADIKPESCSVVFEIKMLPSEPITITKKIDGFVIGDDGWNSKEINEYRKKKGE